MTAKSSHTHTTIIPYLLSVALNEEVQCKRKSIFTHHVLNSTETETTKNNENEIRRKRREENKDEERRRKQKEQDEPKKKEQV